MSFLFPMVLRVTFVTTNRSERAEYPVWSSEWQRSSPMLVMTWLSHWHMWSNTRHYQYNYVKTLPEHFTEQSNETKTACLQYYCLPCYVWEQSQWLLQINWIFSGKQWRNWKFKVMIYKLWFEHRPELDLTSLIKARQQNQSDVLLLLI